MEVRGKEDKSSGQNADGNWPRGRIAPENSVQIKAYYWLPPYVSGFARRCRMEGLMRMLEIKPGTRVLDLGGCPEIWENASVPLDITILNLPGGIPSYELDSLNARTSIHTLHLVEGDTCNVHQFPDRSFDIVFSNSVIEHVGPHEKQEALAREVVRLGKTRFLAPQDGGTVPECPGPRRVPLWAPEILRSLLTTVSQLIISLAPTQTVA